MSKTFFLALPDWSRLKADLEKMRDARLEGALSSSAPTADLALAAREYERGWYDALRYVLALPDEILKDDGNDAQQSEPEKSPDAKRVVPERNGDQMKRPDRFSKPY